MLKLQSIDKIVQSIKLFRTKYLSNL